MRISTAFPSDYLREADLEGAPALKTMGKVEMRELGSDHKPVLFFQNEEKGLVLNKINSSTIVEAYGDDTTGWSGKQIVLYPARTDFQGKSVACIRLRLPKKQSKVETAPQRMAEDMNDEVPF